jgi:hypothetical protein
MHFVIAQHRFYLKKMLTLFSCIALVPLIYFIRLPPFLWPKHPFAMDAKISLLLKHKSADIFITASQSLS